MESQIQNLQECLVFAEKGWRNAISLALHYKELLYQQSQRTCPHCESKFPEILKEIEIIKERVSQNDNSSLSKMNELLSSIEKIRLKSEATQIHHPEVNPQIDKSTGIENFQENNEYLRFNNNPQQRSRNIDIFLPDPYLPTNGNFDPSVNEDYRNYNSQNNSPINSRTINMYTPTENHTIPVTPLIKENKKKNRKSPTRHHLTQWEPEENLTTHLAILQAMRELTELRSRTPNSHTPTRNRSKSINRMTTPLSKLRSQSSPNSFRSSKSTPNSTPLRSDSGKLYNKENFMGRGKKMSF